MPTGFESVLEAWGVPLSPTLAWDTRRSNRLNLTEVVDQGGRQVERKVSVDYPPWPNVGVDGLSEASPITASVAGVSLFWSSAVGAGVGPLPGVAREDLITTSEHGYLVPLPKALEYQAQAIHTANVELSAGGPGARLPLAVALRGQLPSAFAELGVPGKVDAVAEARFRNAVLEAREGRAPWPERTVAHEAGDVLSATNEAAVVVIGDAQLVHDQWLQSNPANGAFVQNALDWLALSGELLELRARRPRERAITDYLGLEREERGLAALVGSLDPDEARRLSALEEEAQSAAARSRWLVMGATLAGTLVLALGGAFLVRRVLARGVA